MHAVSAAQSWEDLALAAPARASGSPEILVVGASRNAGTTTTAAAIVRGRTRAGLRVGVGTITGSGSGTDHWVYVDAGAATVLDFGDFGMPSTFGYPLQRLEHTMVAIRVALVDRGAELVVLEIADGLLQAEAQQLAAGLPGFADAVVLAVADALGAVAGAQLLTELGVPLRAISGRITTSPLAVREAEVATGLPVLSVAQLAEGAALHLLPRRGPWG